MGSRLFTDGDTADVEDLIGAVNTAIRASPQGHGQVFQRPEAVQALKAMNEMNQLMYVFFFLFLPALLVRMLIYSFLNLQVS